MWPPAGNRNIQGNQALLEFVKLAIERQRWENAAHVHDLIRTISTTTPEPEYYYDDLDQIKVKRND